MTRSEARKLSRDDSRKASVFSTQDENGNRKDRRADKFDINGKRWIGQRNQRPQRQAWVAEDENGKSHTLLTPLNRAIKRLTAGRVR